MKSICIKIFYSQIYLDVNILFSQICENFYLLKSNAEHKENFHRTKAPFIQAEIEGGKPRWYPIWKNPILQAIHTERSWWNLSTLLRGLMQEGSILVCWEIYSLMGWSTPLVQSSPEVCVKVDLRSKTMPSGALRLPTFQLTFVQMRPFMGSSVFVPQCSSWWPGLL